MMRTRDPFRSRFNPTPFTPSGLHVALGFRRHRSIRSWALEGALTLAVSVAGAAGIWVVILWCIGALP